MLYSPGKGFGMFCIKYRLSQTGFFPRFEPSVSDVELGAESVHFIKHLRNRHGGWRWYIWPTAWNWKNVRELKRLFRANGVSLHMHYSRKYQEWVLFAVDRDQSFLSDVKKVYMDSENFEKIQERRKKEISERRERFEALQKVLGRNR